MTISVMEMAERFGDREYEIEANGQAQVRVIVHASKGKIEVQLVQLARTEPHTVVLAPSYCGVEYRDPEMVETT